VFTRSTHSCSVSFSLFRSAVLMVLSPMKFSLQRRSAICSVLPVAAVLSVLVLSCGKTRSKTDNGPTTFTDKTGSITKTRSGPEESAALSKTAISATVDGIPIPTSLLTAFALEAAGAVALEEVALDSLLERELRSASITVTSAQEEAERALLYERVSSEANVATAQAGDLIERFRAARGLGPIRFSALLKRTARLRALVVAAGIDPAEVERFVAQSLSPRATARIAVLNSESQAASFAQQVKSSAPDQRSAVFATLAYRQSTDTSAARGGLFGPVAHTDISIPPAVRSRLSDPPGTMSDILAIADGFAVLLIESQSPATTDEPSVQRAKTQAVTRVQREAIDRLAAQLLVQARVTIINEQARWAWRSRGEKPR